MTATRTKLIAVSLTSLAVTVGMALATGTAASADPAASLIGPGPGYVNDPHGVRCVQAVFGLVQDGQYGQATYDAVRNLQQQYGFPADGIVGRRTGNLILARLSAASKISCYPDVPTTWQYILP